MQLGKLLETFAKLNVIAEKCELMQAPFKCFNLIVPFV